MVALPRVSLGLQRRKVPSPFPDRLFAGKYSDQTKRQDSFQVRPIQRRLYRLSKSDSPSRNHRESGRAPRAGAETRGAGWRLFSGCTAVSRPGWVLHGSEWPGLPP